MLQHVTALDNQVIFFCCVLVVFEHTYVYACDPLDSLISGIYTVCTSELCAYKRFCPTKLISVSRRRLVWRSHDASAALVIINHFKADHFLSRRTKGSIRSPQGSLAECDWRHVNARLRVSWSRTCLMLSAENSSYMNLSFM